MNEADALDIVQNAIWTVLVASGPAVLVAMVVGVAIAFVQALTQVQEITLTFVPKIVAILITVAISAPFVGSQISTFTNIVFSASKAVSDRIVSVAWRLTPSRKFQRLVSALSGHPCDGGAVYG